MIYSRFEWAGMKGIAAELGLFVVLLVIFGVGVLVGAAKPEPGFTEEDCAVTWGALKEHPDAEAFDLHIEVRPKENP